jgi:hypothetical protein
MGINWPLLLCPPVKPLPTEDLSRSGEKGNPKRRLLSEVAVVPSLGLGSREHQEDSGQGREAQKPAIEGMWL